MDKLENIAFEVSPNKLMFSKDDEGIVDYMVDYHGKDIMKAFDVRPENTGAAVFFDDKQSKTLVLVLRMKYFEKQIDNGLVMFVIEDLYKSSKAVEDLINIMEKSFDDKFLRISIMDSISQKVLISIDKNA